LLYLAAILEQNKIQVDVKNYSTYQTDTAIADLPEADIYGITTTSMELLQANRFAKLIKDKFKKSKVFLGGPGTCTSEYIDWNVIDSICIGEAEITILNMLKDFEKNNLQKIYHGEPILNLDTLPFPSRHLLKDNLGGNVFAYNEKYQQGGTTVIMTARGCPFHCAFCANPNVTKLGGGKVRYRSAENIYQEMKHIVENYGIKQFRISDDLFSFNKKRVIEVCDKIGNLNINWRISARTTPFDHELAKVMFDAGCREVSFGVESFDDDVLKILNKQTTAKDNVNGLEVAHSAGLKARVLLMIRTPGQTSKTVPINISYLEKVPYNIAACTRFIPMPGSDVWNNPSKYNIEILNKNLDEYNICFFGSKGKHKLLDIIKLKDRNMDEVNKESYEFVDYLEKTGKLNTGK
jgi:radical SAM superfamily enzyme YgiQ (UPF0313 family)